MYEVYAASTMEYVVSFSFILLPVRLASFIVEPDQLMINGYAAEELQNG